jgi:isopropanol dehydrogenase (NADP+)
MQTGKVDPTPMPTHEFGLDEIETAFATKQNKEDGTI